MSRRDANCLEALDPGTCTTGVVALLSIYFRECNNPPVISGAPARCMTSRHCLLLCALTALSWLHRSRSRQSHATAAWCLPFACLSYPAAPSPPLSPSLPPQCWPISARGGLDLARSRRCPQRPLPLPHLLAHQTLRQRPERPLQGAPLPLRYRRSGGAHLH